MFAPIGMRLGAVMLHLRVGNWNPVHHAFRGLFLGKPGNASPVDACANSSGESPPATGGNAHEPPVADLVVKERRPLLPKPVLPPEGFRHHVAVRVQPSE